ncbi:hypothetical protein ACJIZ3_019504 [Penstemon smallii]|uniref:Uncharacterized protein n=1 Tax=Penstemon smallii TaxID=265156 RepID=A0ABD3T1B8_9LAMI
MGESEKHPRLILHNFLSPNIRKELEFIHKSCCSVGYRPNVLSTTLAHLIATNSAHLIMPFIPIREMLKEKVEEHFGCEYELFVEFTGLISWCKGAMIGWHSDDNRDYLKQRDFAIESGIASALHNYYAVPFWIGKLAVCYLNSYDVDFKGGLFHFQDGEPSTVAPMAGITEGERLTLTLWFSRSASYDEDAKLLKSLSEYSVYSSEGTIGSCLPVQASNNMYWFPPEEASKFKSGFDIRCGRLSVLGFDICPSDDECSLSAADISCNFLSLLNDPLHLARGDELLVQEFVNILHALQASELKTAESMGSFIEPLSESQRQKINGLKVKILKELQLAETLFGCTAGGKRLRWLFDSVRFSAAVLEWESYTYKLRKQMVTSLPYWREHQSIFAVVNLD